MDKKRFNFELVVERIKKEFLYRSDKEFAKAIGLSPTAFHNRKKTSSLPFQEIIEFANSRNVNLNWIMTGEGSTYNKSTDDLNTTSNSSNVTKVVIEHQDVVKRFKDSEKAKKFNEILIDLERDDPEGYDDLYKEAKIIHKTIKRMKKKEESKKKSFIKERRANEK